MSTVNLTILWNGTAPEVIGGGSKPNEAHVAKNQNVQWAADPGLAWGAFFLGGSASSPFKGGDTAFGPGHDKGKLILGSADEEFKYSVALEHEGVIHVVDPKIIVREGGSLVAQLLEDIEDQQAIIAAANAEITSLIEDFRGSEAS